MDYVKVNVSKPSGVAPGKGLQIKEIITLIDVTDILTMPQRDEKGVLITDAIVAKDNGYAITVYLTQDTAELASNSDGDTDNEGFTPSVKFKHPGNKQEIREFKSNWIGRKCVAIIDHCDGTPKDLIGSICNPCKMQVNYTANKDATSNEFTFAQMMRGLDIAIYDNTVPYAEPKAVIVGGYTEITLVGEGQYQLTDYATSAAIATVTGAQHGMLFTLLGVTSDTPPFIASGGVFVLKNGTTWNANTGSQITFKAFKDGASTFKYIEQSRV